MDKSVSEKEYKRIILDLLNKFVSFCEDNQLTYYLAFGSLLGAVRHKGLIPWDDDIDVTMPRDDYNKFIELVAQQKPDFLLFCDETTNNYPHYFAKISDKSTILDFKYMKNIDSLGIFVDIFPMDIVHVENQLIDKYEKQLIRYIKLLELSAMNKCWPADNIVKTTLKNILFRYCKLRGQSYWKAKHNRLIEQICKDNSNNTQYMFARRIIDVNSFGKDFCLEYEGKNYSCPVCYDKYLKKVYGNYMELPPENKRTSVHDFDTYFK